MSADLGPSTDALFARAFADALMLTAQAAGKLLGMDVRTLRTLTDEGFIRAVRRGKRRAYIEADLRAYLSTSPDAGPRPKKEPPCPSIGAKRAKSGTMTSSLKVVAFTDLQAKRAAEPPRP